jgi:hypothetical protein
VAVAVLVTVMSVVTPVASVREGGAATYGERDGGKQGYEAIGHAQLISSSNDVFPLKRCDSAADAALRRMLRG